MTDGKHELKVRSCHKGTSATNTRARSMSAQNVVDTCHCNTKSSISSDARICAKTREKAREATVMSTSRPARQQANANNIYHKGKRNQRTEIQSSAGKWSHKVCLTFCFLLSPPASGELRTIGIDIIWVVKWGMDKMSRQQHRFLCAQEYSNSRLYQLLPWL